MPIKYRDHAWFVGYAPADAPEIVVAVLIEHGGHGGSAAAPIAQRVLARWSEKHLPGRAAGRRRRRRRPMWGIDRRLVQNFDWTLLGLVVLR